MHNKKILMCIAIFITLIALGCKDKKTVEACADPNCADPVCVTPGAQTFTTTLGLEPQSVCPIMGAPIDKAIYVDKGNLRIYVSDESSKKELADNFDKYIEELKGMGQKPETIQ